MQKPNAKKRKRKGTKAKKSKVPETTMKAQQKKEKPKKTKVKKKRTAKKVANPEVVADRKKVEHLKVFEHPEETALIGTLGSQKKVAHPAANLEEMTPMKPMANLFPFKETVANPGVAATETEASPE